MGMHDNLISHLLVTVASSNCSPTALMMSWRILVRTSVLCLDTMLNTYCVGTMCMRAINEVNIVQCSYRVCANRHM